ncbi:mycothiol synthase [Serinibacter salmoneus]|uniref:Mycothiol synthase n=1 Tax=Serinibacter salmoneus TaxID=556530 RepID=A0A2A9CWQ8_9MICO|nr:mycothiol synthase [Serinibacter salmoneus]PFG18867.1 mycothiol synthase [Serinibacter salmoneus]
MSGAEASIEVAEALALAARVAEHDGVAALSEDHRLALEGGRPGHLAWRGGDGALVALAARAHDAVELMVDPAHRRLGWGSQALGEVLAEEPETRLWAHGDLPGARALAASAGLRPVRELLKMSRALGEAQAREGGAVDAADGVTLDLVALDEATDPDRHRALWLDLNRRAFADHPEQGRWGQDDLAAREAEAWFEPALMWLAYPRSASGEVAPRPAASVWVKAEAPQRAEIYVLAVDPEQAGRRVGTRVLAEALAQVARRGWREVELYVDGANLAAVRLYEGQGFAVETRDVQYVAATG